MYRIVDYLHPKDIYNLRLINNQLSSTIKYDIININMRKHIRLRLFEIFEINTDKFLDLLEQNQGIISGSFILQSILNERWNGSDIDIYLPSDKKSDQFTTIEDFFHKKATWITSESYVSV